MDTLRVRCALAPMQFNDSARQQAHDVNVVFSRDYDVIVGTESGQDNALFELVGRVGPQQGYRLAHFRSQWVAVRHGLFSGGWSSGYIPVIESTEGFGRHPDRGIVWAAGNTDGYGRLTIGGGHLLTHGDHPGDPNFRLNSRYTRAIGAFGERRGKGSGVVLYAGDQNDDDAHGDTFRGAPFTSCWDELGKHPGTHGKRTIDVWASYDPDKRVKCAAARSLRDGRVFLNTDHNLTEAEYDIRPKGAAR